MNAVKALALKLDAETLRCSALPIGRIRCCRIEGEVTASHAEPGMDGS